MNQQKQNWSFAGIITSSCVVVFSIIRLIHEFTSSRNKVGPVGNGNEVNPEVVFSSIIQIISGVILLITFIINFKNNSK